MTNTRERLPDMHSTVVVIRVFGSIVNMKASNARKSETTEGEPSSYNWSWYLGVWRVSDNKIPLDIEVEFPLRLVSTFTSHGMEAWSVVTLY